MSLWQAWGFTSHGRGTNVAGVGVAPTYSFNDPGHGTNVAGAVFYMLLGISLFKGNMVASGFESYLVALCFYSVGRCLHWFVSYPVL